MLTSGSNNPQKINKKKKKKITSSPNYMFELIEKFNL